MAKPRSARHWWDARPRQSAKPNIVEQIEGNVEGEDGEGLILPANKQDDQQRNLCQRGQEY